MRPVGRRTPSLAIMRPMSGFLALAVGVLLVVVGNADAWSSCATRVSPFAEGPPTFKVVACSTDAVELSKYDKFIHFMAKTTPDVMAFQAGQYAYMLDFREGLRQCNQSPARGIPYGKAALADLAKVRKALKELQDDHNGMKEVADFARQRKHTLAIDAALLKLQGGIKQMSDAVDVQAAAANALIDPGNDCSFAGHQSNKASELMEAAFEEYAGGLKEIVKVLNDIYESSPCKEDVSATPPMSDAQINRTAGGGGVQRGGSAQDLSVVAPKRLRTNTRAATTLPLTLKFSGPGRVEIWVTRATRLLLNVQATASKPVSVGLVLKLRNANSKGNLKVKFSYATGVRLTPTRTFTLTIRRS